MTVRWKPLLVLSGVFLVTALGGVVAIAFVMMNASARDILPKARAEAKAGQYDRALIQYRRALQQAPKDPEIHEELAVMLAKWAEQAPAEKRPELLQQHYAALIDAVRFGPRAVGPRRALLTESLRLDEMGEAARWARELVSLAPEDPDAHFALAVDALKKGPAGTAEARKQIEHLGEAETQRVRSMWLVAWLAREERDEATLEKMMEAAREVDVARVADPSDRLAFLRLLAFDAQRAQGQVIADRVPMFQAVAKAIAEEQEAAPNRVSQMSDLVGQVRTALVAAKAGADTQSAARLDSLAQGLDAVVETTFRRAIDGKAPDLRLFDAYADFLLDRERHAEALDIAGQGLKKTEAGLASFRATVSSLRETAVRASLGKQDDPGRFDKAAPFIKAMIASSNEHEQGVGHLFQGAIALERSGLTGVNLTGPAPSPTEVERLRNEALDHLKPAAAELTKLPAAQALYGITLILSHEPALGRQYLQAARRAGPLEAKYQVWAAWSMVQAGYPEEAEPIVKALREQLKGTDGEYEPALRMLEGEMSQARRDPEDLKRARRDYQEALASSRESPAGVELKLAQVDIQLKEHDAALARIEKLRKAGKSNAAAEQMATVALLSAGRDQEAREVLAKARPLYPESGELACLDGALKLRDDQAEAADKVLAEFLAAHPDHAGAVNMRAQVLSEKLHKADEARKLLRNLAEKSKTTDPWVQLAEFELGQRNYTEMARAIAQLRAQWKEAAAADVLDAQLALAAKSDYRGASKALESALRKDPDNKVALFWKAQIDETIGGGADAAKVYQDLVREQPVKELDTGLSLATAAQWALATQALDNREVDTAINRLGELLKNGGQANAELNRAIHWKLAFAYAAKGNWPAARSELVTILKDPNTTNDERVRASNFCRENKDETTANQLLDGVLKDEPAHPAAIVSRAYVLSDAGQADAAIRLVRQAIAARKQPAGVHLMLAALENVQKPRDAAAARALKALDDGLKAHADNIDLVRARYKLMVETDKSAAITWLEERAATAKGPEIRRLLAESYRERGDFTKAEQTARDLVLGQPKDQPQDPTLTALLLRVLLAQAASAAEQGDSAQERATDEKTLRLLRQARADFPSEIAFPRAEWELAMRRRDHAQALAVCQEIETIAPRASLAPMLRAQVFAAQGRVPEVAQSYAEAAEREPRRLDVKLLLAQTQLGLGKTDDCLRLASAVLEADKDQPGAIILKARALIAFEGPATQVNARRDEAAKLLRDAIKAEPKFREAYQTLADLEQRRGRRAEAVKVLDANLQANPDDATGLALLAQALSAPRDGKAAPAEDIQRVKALAEEHGGKDTQGQKCLALAIGLQRAQRLDLAIPWAKKAVGLIQSPAVHQTYGDALLARAEQLGEGTEARDLFQQAITEYDAVLKVNPNSIEAVNNKAWVLHRYLNDNPAALELAEGLLKRVDRSVLPPEFLDTLGAIQESANRPKEAEATYNAGLSKAPKHPFLNFHMGRLIAADTDRRDQAVPYLQTAQATSDRLPPTMVAELKDLLRSVTR